MLLGIRASIGACHVAPPHLKGANLSRGVARIECAATLKPEFLVAFLRSGSASEYWSLMRQGSTFNEVSIETVREMHVPLPPPTEQLAIVKAIEEACDRLAALIGDTERAIALLRERRAALISAAVTGKIDLRALIVQPAAEAA